MSQINSPGSSPSVTTRFYWVIGLFVFITLSILVLDYMRAYVIDAVRAYAVAEGAYSKGQKDAINHLLRYAYNQDPAQYTAFQENLAAPLGDHEARIALQLASPDYAAARAGFLKGRNHPEDIDKMISLFLNLGEFPEMEKAIEIWTEADGRVQALVQIGQKLHTEIQSGLATPARIVAITKEIEDQNVALTMLEDQFSATLGEGARKVGLLTGYLTIGVTCGLLFFGTLMSLSITRGIRHTQAELVESESRFRRIVESNIIGIVFWGANGEVYDANDAFLSSIGYSREHLPDLNWRDITKPESWAADDEALAEVRKFGVCTPYEKLFRHKDGHTVYSILGAAMINSLTQNGVAFVLDISEQRLLEEQLNQSQKLEAIGTLVGGIAHDFNNTLTAMYGNIELARDDNHDPTVEGYLDTLKKLSEHSAKIVGQLMAFARKDIVRLKPISANALLSDIEEFARGVVPESILFEVNVCPETLSIKGDETQLHQALLNLISNARDAVETVDEPHIECGLEIAQRSGREFAELSVKDNGIGITDEELERIYEPFFTTKPVGKGTGLGMSMVYGSMVRHGGEVQIESVPGAGTEVRLFIPLFEGARADPVETGRRTEKDSGQSTVMIVDDEPAVRSTCATYLENMGFKTVVAEDGARALAQIVEEPTKFDLLVTDVVMPIMGGVKLAREVRKILPEISIIMMTGYRPDEVAAGKEVTEANTELLMKPFPPQALANIVSRLLSRNSTDGHT